MTYTLRQLQAVCLTAYARELHVSDPESALDNLFSFCASELSENYFASDPVDAAVTALEVIKDDIDAMIGDLEKLKDPDAAEATLAAAEEALALLPEDDPT